MGAGQKHQKAWQIQEKEEASKRMKDRRRKRKLRGRMRRIERRSRLEPQVSSAQLLCAELILIKDAGSIWYLSHGSTLDLQLSQPVFLLSKHSAVVDEGQDL